MLDRVINGLKGIKELNNILGEMLCYPENERILPPAVREEFRTKVRWALTAAKTELEELRRWCDYMVRHWPRG